MSRRISNPGRERDECQVLMCIGEAAEAGPRCNGGGAGGGSVVVDRHSTAALRRQLPDLTKCHRTSSCRPQRPSVGKDAPLARLRWYHRVRVVVVIIIIYTLLSGLCPTEFSDYYAF